jgi:hypothetical protein
MSALGQLDEPFPETEQNRLEFRVNPQLREDAPNVAMHRMGADEHLPGDLIGRLAVGDGLKDLDLAFGKLLGEEAGVGPALVRLTEPQE